MPWLNEIISAFIGKAEVDVESIKKRINKAATGSEKLTNEELTGYVDDIESRVRKMVKELKTLYKKYNIDFSGFKSFETAIVNLRESIKNNSEEAYNNLIKLESVVTAEQKRHL